MLEKTYNPNLVEDKIYASWMQSGIFNSQPNPLKESFSIVIPPPNVTGVLHMGHMLNNTIQDVLIRRARMKGKEACWVPGTDHASIATETKVVAMLKEKGIDKKNLSREEFLKYAWDWKEKHGNIILEQLKKLGASCDWKRTRFTMEKDLTDSVIKVFINLYNKGLIYRGVRMVNWDPKSRTAVSDEEVIHKEVDSKLFYIKYFLANPSDQYLLIATTRPETILGDSAVCVNPFDERYKHYIGQKIKIPLINREITIIADEYVDPTFGSGCLKVTPAHDINDYRLGQKYNLDSIDIFNPDGTLSEKAILYIGLDRFKAREKIVEELDSKGYFEKIEKIKNKIGFSERTDVIIEPRLSTQWFLKMEKLAKPALEVIMDDTIKLFPPKFKNLYKHWMENVHDWCISRQLWWGQRIPAWYCSCHDCKEVIIVQVEKPDKCPKCNCSKEIFQDEDVLDTWFSSWLWPISVFNGINDPDNKDISYYYPTDTLVTAPEILFFWVARMIVAGMEYRKKIPFKNVYLTGIVRDKQGKKMSKSLGNSPEPLDLISKYGADSVRVGMMLCSPAGNDLLYDESLIIQGRNFSNKIWNSYRLISGWKIDENLPYINETPVLWFQNRFNQIFEEHEKLINDFRISEALMSVYKLVWDDFCSLYLEMVKPEREKPIDINTYNYTKQFFLNLLKLLHPYVPFISEYLWQELKSNMDTYIATSHYPIQEEYNSVLLNNFKISFQLINSIRNIRIENKIGLKDPISLKLPSTLLNTVKPYHLVISKLCNLSHIASKSESESNGITFMVQEFECIALSTLNLMPNTPVKYEKIAKEIEYLTGFLDSIKKKLNNPQFISHASKEVIDRELTKKKDAETKILVLKKSLK